MTTMLRQAPTNSCRQLRDVLFIRRGFHTETTSASAGLDRLRRSYLYVPCSSERMLNKSLSTNSDIIIYDLEDSVAPEVKPAARKALKSFLSRSHDRPLPEGPRIALRVNAIDTPFFEEDIAAAASLSNLHTIVLPKVHSSKTLDEVGDILRTSSKRVTREHILQIVASIESARALWDIGHIASWKSRHGVAGGVLSSLLFAAEDFCADTSIIRTPQRTELLFTRSQIAIAAKAHRLEAIDMVCVDYKDEAYLRDECEDGRRLGYTGKQAIHPAQVDIIQQTFVPTEKEIARAAKIVRMMANSHEQGTGAFGLDMSNGGREMIDAPMLKQAQNVVRIAKMAGLQISD